MWVVAANNLINLDCVKQISKTADHICFLFTDNTYTEVVCNSEPEAMASLKQLVSLTEPKCEVEGDEYEEN